MYFVDEKMSMAYPPNRTPALCILNIGLKKLMINYMDELPLVENLRK